MGALGIARVKTCVTVPSLFHRAIDSDSSSFDGLGLKPPPYIPVAGYGAV